MQHYLFNNYHRNDLSKKVKVVISDIRGAIFFSSLRGESRILSDRVQFTHHADSCADLSLNHGL